MFEIKVQEGFISCPILQTQFQSQKINNIPEFFIQITF